MKRKPLEKCPACHGFAHFKREVFDGETREIKKIRCEFCKGYGMVSALQKVNYWKAKRYDAKTQSRPEGISPSPSSC